MGSQRGGIECTQSPALSFAKRALTRPSQFAQLEIAEPVPTPENAIQAQMGAIGIHLANILQDTYRSTPLVFSIVRKHSAILDGWRRSLPPAMQLSSILESSSSSYSSAYGLEDKHRRSLVLVHVMGFGAQILLQRRLLVAMAECKMNNRWMLDGPREEGARIQQECVGAARACVQLLDVLGYTRNMFRRCWLCM